MSNTLGYSACQWTGNNDGRGASTAWDTSQINCQTVVCSSLRVQIRPTCWLTRVTHLTCKHTSPHFPESPGFDIIHVKEDTVIQDWSVCEERSYCSPTRPLWWWGKTVEGDLLCGVSHISTPNKSAIFEITWKLSANTPEDFVQFELWWPQTGWRTRLGVRTLIGEAHRKNRTQEHSGLFTLLPIHMINSYFLWTSLKTIREILIQYMTTKCLFYYI